MAKLYANEEVEKILTASSRKGEDDLKPSNAIVWFIPKESTMIAPPTRQTKKKGTIKLVPFYLSLYYAFSSNRILSHKVFNGFFYV